MASYFKEGEEAKSAQTEESIGFISKIRLMFHALNDKMQFYTKQRWISVGVLGLIYIIRLIITRGYQALTYCIGIHFLNSFIGFISPMIDPESDELTSENDSYLPQSNSEEFRPFQRKLKEYHFWQAMFITLLVATIMTFSPVFDVPVFWPLLLIYFLMIFFITMRNQIMHMIKFNYLPWDIGKIQYTRIPTHSNTHTYIKIQRSDPEVSITNTNTPTATS